MKRLTPAQTRVIDFIEQYQRQKQMPPTWREICDGLGFRSLFTVHCHLKAMMKKGVVTYDRFTSRTTRSLRFEQPLKSAWAVLGVNFFLIARCELCGHDVILDGKRCSNCTMVAAL